MSSLRGRSSRLDRLGRIRFCHYADSSGGGRRIPRWAKSTGLKSIRESAYKLARPPEPDADEHVDWLLPSRRGFPAPPCGVQGLWTARRRRRPRALSASEPTWAATRALRPEPAKAGDIPAFAGWLSTCRPHPGGEDVLAAVISCPYSFQVLSEVKEASKRLALGGAAVAAEGLSAPGGVVSVLIATPM